MSLKPRELGIWFFFMLCSLTSIVYLICYDHMFDDYTYITFLPLTFFLCSVVFANVYSCLLENVGVLCLHSVMFVRLVVTPVFMTSAGYSSIFREITEQNVNYAITLMCYECVMIYFVLAFFVIRNKNKHKENALLKAEYTIQFRKPKISFQIIVMAMTAYCIVVWIFVPTCRELYKTVFEFNEIGFSNADYSASNEAVGSMSRSMLTLFKVFFDIVRIVLPMYLIITFKRWGFSPFISIITGILFAFLQLLFISQTTARAIICAYLIIYFISRLYPKHAKRIMNIAVVSALMVVVIYFVIRFTVGSRYGSSPNEYMSKILVAYFGGVDNVAAGANLPDGHEVSTFWASLYSAIPFNSTLFGLKVEKLQSIYNAVNYSYGQIPPMIVEGAYYFGELFSPVMSCACAVGAYYYGEKFSNTNSSWHLISNLFLAIIFAISVVMYNEEILLVWLFEWLVPMKILSRLAE